MKRCGLLWIWLLFTFSAVSQDKIVDSLNQLIKLASNDTIRIQLLIKKIDHFQETNYDSALVYAKQAITLSDKADYPAGKLDGLSELATTASRQGDYVLASQSLHQADQLKTIVKDSARNAKIYSNYGMMYGMQSKYDSSIIYYHKAIGIYEKLQNKSRLSSSLSNIAIGYQMQSNFSKALEYQQKALEIAESIKDLTSQAYTLTNMGNTYQNIGDTTRAIATLSKAIAIARIKGLKNVEIYCYSNIASDYIDLEQYDSAYTFALKAATLAKETKDLPIEASSLSKASMALTKMGRLDEAGILSKEAIAKAVSTGQPLNISQAYNSMGMVAQYRSNYAVAIGYYEKCLKVMDKASLFDATTGEIYLDLSACYEKTGNYKKALENFQKSKYISDSVTSHNNIRKATELTLNNEFEKKQNITRAEQDKQNAISKSKQLLLLVGLGLTLIIAIIAWGAFTNKQNANRLLQKQKEEVQVTLAQLKTTQAQLIQAEKMASLGELTAGIAHEIQNPLNFVNNFSEVNTELVDDLEEEIKKSNWKEVATIASNIRENEQKIVHHGKRADAIVKSMLQHSRNNTGQKELTDINALADEYLRLSYHGLRAKDKTFNASIETDFDPATGSKEIVSQEIGRVLLNLYNNAFYAVKEKTLQTATTDPTYVPTINVKTRRNGNKVQITVRDNGNGIPSATVDKIFQPFFTTKPTGEGTGLGLSLSYDIITKGHNGELKVNSQDGSFTEFTIIL